MLPNEKAAVDRYLRELIVAAEYSALVAISYFQVEAEILSKRERDVVESKVIDADKLHLLFNVIKEKESGWLHLLTYLRVNGQSDLADKLQNYADSTSETNASTMRTRSVLEDFSVRLADYYQTNYANVPTMWESPKHVKDVWVPLQIDGKEFLAADRIDHVELLNRLQSNQSRNVALIKGDPGMGKTTLAKKIAYEWATKYGSSNVQLFGLVLAVPLRSAGKSHRFDQLAIEYFLSVLDMEANILTELIGEINQMGSQLLVILDGLDEYVNYSESPFKDMFARPFQQSAAYCNVPPPTITFKLIVTSRPYACKRISEDFFPLRFVILQLDEKHLGDFVRLYCESSRGIAKVTEYLKVNTDFVVKVPLILTFVCYLADLTQEIPTNMTSLYDKLIWQMIRREIRQGKLAESVDIHKRKQSNLMKTTGELAFWEIKKKNFEFTKDSLDNSRVTNDSFICGFLLHKFDFAKDLLKAEFPHRSIQEFFAALHCYQLMLTGCKDELGDIRKLILSRDSQFGRFLFGICSQERQFVQMTNWLSPSLGDSGKIWSSGDEINQFGTSLIDCSPEDNILMGHKLLFSLQLSIAHLKERATSQVHMYWIDILDRVLRLHNLSAEFKDSLHLVDLTRDSNGNSYDWFMADNRQSARLAVVSFRLPELLKEKFNRIDILIWRNSIDITFGKEWKTLFSQIRSLPPVRTFILSTGSYLSSAVTSVFVLIGYGRTTGSELTNFLFDYDREERKELLEAIPDETFVKLTETKREKKIDLKGRSFIDINVTVDSCDSQSALISSLFRLSFFSPVRSSDHRCVCI